MLKFYGRIRYGVLVGTGILVLVTAGISKGATRQEIDDIRRLSVLSDKHLVTLEEYITGQFRSILRAEETSEVSLLTKDLMDITETKITVEETLRLYLDRYAGAAQKAYPEVYERGQTLSGGTEQKQKLLGNQLKLTCAVVLATGDSPTVIDDLLKMLGDELSEVRYWGAKGLSKANIKKSLEATDTPEATVSKVLEGLRKCLDQEEEASVIAQISAAADLKGNRESGAIIQSCAAKRLEQYRQWKVQGEWVDQDIILRLVNAVGSETAKNDKALQKELMRSAANLYSAAYNRFLKGMVYEDEEGNRIVLLSVISEQSLSTLLIEGEIAIVKLVNQISGSARTGRFLPALKDRNWNKIKAAYNALLGENGIIPKTFEIYAPGGGPPELPDPPQEIIDRAKTLGIVKEKTIGQDY